MSWQRKKKNRRIQSKSQAPAPQMSDVLHDSRLRRVLAVSVLVLVVLAFAWQLRYWLKAMDDLTLQQVHVEGQFKQLKRNQVRELLGTYAGQNFFDVDVAVIKHDLEQQPWVREASVRRQWPDSIIVKLYEQTPVARWGERGLITADAQIFYPAGNVPQLGFESLPRLDGVANSEHELLSRLGTVSELLGRLTLKVVSMGIDARRAWSIRLDNGLELLLGREQTMQRIQRFLRFYLSVMAQRADAVEAVDLRYPNGFVLRWSATAKQTPLG